jgi:hypothetical protein
MERFLKALPSWAVRGARLSVVGRASSHSGSGCNSDSRRGADGGRKSIEEPHSKFLVLARDYLRVLLKGTRADVRRGTPYVSATQQPLSACSRSIAATVAGTVHGE